MTSSSTITTSEMAHENEVEPLPSSLEQAGAPAAELSVSARNASILGTPLVPRNAGDQINRFLLCALIRESAKEVKTAADRSGICLPVTKIVRSLLTSYGRAAVDNPGLLSGPTFNSSILKGLNEKLRKDQIGRHSQEIVSNSRLLLAHARRIGDPIRIKAAEEALEGAVSARDRVTEPE